MMDRNRQPQVAEAELANLFSHYLNSEAASAALEGRISLLRDKLGPMVDRATERRSVLSSRSLLARTFDWIAGRLFRHQIGLLREELEQEISVLTESVDLLMGDLRSAYRRELLLAQRSVALTMDQLTLLQAQMKQNCPVEQPPSDKKF